MLAHVPLNAHGNAQSVLIIGGGDGGLLEEVLKHDTVDHVTMVEIDKEVIAAAKEFLPSICKKAFEDHRTNLVIADAFSWVLITANTTNKKFDLILIDRSDGIGPNQDLYSSDFYSYCKKLLNPRGILVAQTGVLQLSYDHILYQKNLLHTHWSQAGAFFTVLPSYSGGVNILTWAADWHIENSDIVPSISDLKYYNEKIHKSAFVLPTFASKLTSMNLRVI